MDPELRQMLTVTIVGILLAAAVLVLAVPRFKVFGDRVAQYSANISEEKGIFHVSERYIYRLINTHHLIYRDWYVPVTLTTINKPHVRVVSVSCPSGTIPYFANPGKIVQHLGPVYAMHSTDTGPYYLYFVGGHWVSEQTALSRYPRLPVAYVHEAEDPEVGCVSTSGVLAPGEYAMGISFDLYPPIQCDGHYCHANVSLAGNRHFDYQHVSIRFEGNDVVDYAQRPPAWFLSLFGLPGGDYLEIESLLKPVNYPFVSYASDVANRYRSAACSGLLGHYAYAFAVLAVVLVPLFIFLYWWFFARDRPDPSVPDYLMNVPNRERKPWVVNAVFDGVAGKFSKDAFIATLLDLRERGIVEITGTGKDDVSIRVLSAPEDLDEYEQAVVRFIAQHSTDGVFSPRAFADALKHADGTTFERLHKEWEMVAGDSPIARNVARMFVQYPSMLLSGLALGLGALFVILWNAGAPGIFGWAAIALLAYGWLVSRMPPEVLGRWKNGYGREYTQWQAFKRFLSDLTMIRKYSEQFQPMWHDWLVYGAALGDADNVLKALRELNVPDVESFWDTYFAIAVATNTLSTAYTVRAAELAAKSAAAAAGGFGAGGGFGGGGAGAR
ncbi:MAG: DUF2207 domain-containing protein [Candidatus Diapherotrites archaeon]|nr:DUF2207 domain-containing protein [Candidatus Diapherotrites archaeon]